MVGGRFDREVPSEAGAGLMAEQDVTHTLVKLDGVTARHINQNFRDVQQFVNGQTVHTDGTGLASALNAVAVWQNWTPALTAITTDPTLGTGSSATGRYIRFGDVVLAETRIVFGTSGVAAGNGEYRVSLPVNAATASAQIGSGLIYDSSVATYRRVAALRGALNATVAQLVADSVVAHNNPWTWAASDFITVQFMYEAA
jgi:hypothetical protein